jgi:hypothetical protein
MESKLLQTKDIGDFASVTVCYFGSCTPAAALGTRLPSRDSYSYLCQSRHAPRTTADAPDSEILRNPGEISGLRAFGKPRIATMQMTISDGTPFPARCLSRPW